MSGFKSTYIIIRQSHTNHIYYICGVKFSVCRCGRAWGFSSLIDTTRCRSKYSAYVRNQKQHTYNASHICGESRTTYTLFVKAMRLSPFKMSQVSLYALPHVIVLAARSPLTTRHSFTIAQHHSSASDAHHGLCDKNLFFTQNKGER